MSEVIRDITDLERLDARIGDAAARAVSAIRGIVADGDPLEVLARVRFHAVGFHPIGGDALNLIEQINQTFNRAR